MARRHSAQGSRAASARVPLLLHSEIKRIIEECRVVPGELTVVEQDGTVNDKQQTEEATKTHEGQDGAGMIDSRFRGFGLSAERVRAEWHT